ncbi:hypothetical protein LCGC14_0365780 [marine sediment metagenome]|uniref:Uncharacterized protein n=1 Tax=marine sediment metagenome TaxID=412755 RepID=A0A0F9VTZ5_9ZZZZ
MVTARDLRKVLKKSGHSEDTEITKYKGKYHLLHIFKNGNTVPLIISEDIEEIKDHIDLYIIT